MSCREACSEFPERETKQIQQPPAGLLTGHKGALERGRIRHPPGWIIPPLQLVLGTPYQSSSSPGVFVHLNFPHSSLPSGPFLEITQAVSSFPVRLFKSMYKLPAW